MFGAPSGKALVTLTPAATAEVKRLMAAKAGMAGVRLGLRKGGCAGMEYVMEPAAEIGAHDDVIDQDGARLLIAPTAAMFLIGVEIDYKTGLLESGFDFRNPNVVDACGCGESVKFAPLDPPTAQDADR